jgi:hypothetical protein
MKAAKGCKQLVSLLFSTKVEGQKTYVGMKLAMGNLLQIRENMTITDECTIFVAASIGFALNFMHMVFFSIFQLHF